MKTYYFFTGICFVALSCAVLGLVLLAEKTVADGRESVLSYRHLSNVEVYDSPRAIRTGESFASLKKILPAAGYAECVAAPAALDELPIKTFCQKGDRLFVKSAPPFASYIFVSDERKLLVRKILDLAGQEISAAEIPSGMFASVFVNKNGEVSERTRFELFRGKTLSGNIKSDFLQICLNEEDRAFFEHRGTNWHGLARAVWQNIKIIVLRRKDQPLQGGSSITEQTAKLLFAGDDRGILRRVWSAFLADAMEQEFTKVEILEFWANSTVLGIESPNRSEQDNKKAMMRERLFGFQTAARSLFGKNWQELKPSEQALLAVLPRNPQIAPVLRRDGKLNLTNPNHRKLEEKRKTALITYAAKLESLGEKTKAKIYLAAVNQQVVFKFKEDDLLADEALSIFLEKDLKRLSRELSLLASGESLTVVTSVDREFQKSLSYSISNEMLSNRHLIKKTLPAKTVFDLQADVAVISAVDGDLKAFTSLKTSGTRILPNRSNINSPSQIASPAKPLHLAAALSTGRISLDTIIRPDTCFSPDGFQFESERRSNALALPVWQHLIYSNNNAFICVGNALGISATEGKWREVFDLATPSKEEYQKMDGHPYQLLRGVNRLEAELTPVQVAEGYTALANHGQRSAVRVIKAVYAGREKIELPRSEPKSVFTSDAADAVSLVLRMNARTNLKSLKPQSTLAIKTGSSPYSYWLVMYSPKVVVVGRFLISGPVKSKLLQDTYARDTIQPFMEKSVLKILQETRPEWLTGNFE